MAKIKIFQVSGSPRTPGTPDVSGALVPLSAATQFGKGVSSFGKAVEAVALENKAEEDANEAADIITGVNNKITDIYGKYKRSTKSTDVLQYGKDLDEIEVEGSNKSVNKLVEKYIRKKKNSTSLTLGKEILNRSILASEDRKNKELDSYITKATSDNPLERLEGDRLYKAFFGSPENFQFYGEKKLGEIKKKKDLVYLKNIYIKGIDNQQLDILDNDTRADILKKFGPIGGKSLLEKGRAKLISDVIQEEELQLNEERATVRTQLENFSSIIDNLNKSKIADGSKNITLDEIHDLYQIRSINTAQYNALVSFYASDETFKDEELVNVINAQIAAANSVSDLDAIQDALNNDKDLLKGVPPDQVVEFHKIIEKYRGDTDGFNDYKIYQDKIKKDMGDLGLMVINMTAKRAEAKEKSAEALQQYNKYINSGLSAQDAYLKTIYTYAEKDLPKPERLPMPAFITISDFKQVINKNPDTAQDAFEKRIVQQLKEKKIDIRTYKESIKRLDFMFDVLSVRKNMFGEQDKKEGPFKYLGAFGRVKKDG